MIFEISCSIFRQKKNCFFIIFIFYFLFQFSLFQKSQFWIFFFFLAKNTPKLQKLKKTAKINKLPYNLSNFIKKIHFLTLTVFSRTFDMEMPISKIKIKINTCSITCPLKT